MPREDWADFAEALDAFWSATPPTGRDENGRVWLRMPVEDAELWHQFAAVAERHETARLINANRGSHRDAFGRPVVRP